MVEVAVYRVVVEALANAARHGSGRRAHVPVVVQGPLLRVEITDDGEPGGRRSAGVGLQSMRERAEEVDGRLATGPGLVEGGGGAVVLKVPTA